MKDKYLGIDIGGTSVKIGLVDEDANILYAKEYAVAFDNYKTPILDTVLKSSSLFLEEFEIDKNSLKGIGVSATGQIDSLEGKVAGTGGNIRNWDNSQIKKDFEKKFDLPTVVVNDANCVALGEKWMGAARENKNFIVITIGTGLGGGIFVDNKIVLGRVGFAGELGHFSIDKNGRTCTCGNKGCYEQYASMTALINQVKIKYNKNNIDFESSKINGRYLFSKIEEDDIIKTSIEEWINDIASGLVSLTHIFNPEKIIIGGGVSARKDFVDKLSKEVLTRVMPNFAKNLEIVAAKLGNNAGLVGAVYYLREEENK